jgi:hypothetical protein
MPINYDEDRVNAALKLIQGESSSDLKEGGGEKQYNEERVLAALSVINGEGVQEDELTTSQKALQVARGAAITYGGITDVVGNAADGGYSNEFGIGGPIKSSEDAESKYGINLPERKNVERQDQDYSSATDAFTKGIDSIAGRDLTPTDSAGELRQTFGSFAAPFPIPGAKLIKDLLWAAPIAIVSQGLKELGLDKNYSDLMSGIGTPNYKLLLKLPVEALRKLSDYVLTMSNSAYRGAGGVEEASKFLQNTVGDKNIPEVVSNIENFKSPFKGELDASGNVLKPGYRPTTAEVADNVGLSQYHRSKYETVPELGERHKENMSTLRDKVDSQASKLHSAQNTQDFARSDLEQYSKGLDNNLNSANNNLVRATDEFGSGLATKEGTGGSVQDYLSERNAEIRSNAQANSKPHYDAARPINIESPPSNAISYIDGEISNWSKSSPIHTDLKNSKSAIENAKIGGDDLPRQKQKQQIMDLHKGDASKAEKHLKELGLETVSDGQYNIGKLDNAKKEISAILESIPTTERERRRVLSKVLEGLEKDVSHVPEISRARKVYSEIMEPANAIAENPVLGDIIKRDGGFTKPFTVTRAEIPDRIISGNKSVSAAEAIMSEAAGLGTREHSSMMNCIRSYIDSDILSSFVNRAGRVNPNKYNDWIKRNPGALIMYPGLDEKLASLSSAQQYVHTITENNKNLLKEYHAKALDAVIGNGKKGISSDKIANKILSSGDAEGVMDDVMKLVSKDKSGAAREGLKRAFVDDLFGKFKSDSFTFATFNDYLKKNRKSFGKIFDQSQMKVIEDTRDLLSRGAAVDSAGRMKSGSDTASKLLANVAEKLGKNTSKVANIAGKGAGLTQGIINVTYDLASDTKQYEKLKYLELALQDPKMAKFLLQKDVKTKQNFFESIRSGNFDKWLRNSDTFFNSVKETIKMSGGNPYATSQAVIRSGLSKRDSEQDEDSKNERLKTFGDRIKR